MGLNSLSWHLLSLCFNAVGGRWKPQDLGRSWKGVCPPTHLCLGQFNAHCCREVPRTQRFIKQGG